MPSTVQRGRVQPHRVLVVGGHEDRAVGQPVEVGGVGPAAFDHGVHRVLRADPVEIGSAGGELADAAAHLGELVCALERHRVLVEAEQQVVVAVDDARGDQAARRGDALSGRSGRRPRHRRRRCARR